MEVEKVYCGIRYRLSNDDLQVGDKVYPIADGRCLPDDTFILHGFDFRLFCSGFPYEPHIITNMHYSDSKPYEISTDHGFGPRESYYKIIKRERHVRIIGKLFDSWEWVEMNVDEPIEMICEKCEKVVDDLCYDNCCEKCSKYSSDNI